MRLQRILVPVDFSTPATQAATIAVQLASRHEATVRVLHVDPFPGAATLAVEPVYIPPDFLGGVQADYDRRIQNELETLTRELEKPKGPAVTVETERRMSDVVPGILEEASEWKSDLIVMGSSGLSGAARLLLGSVADKISRRAPCPVLVTRARDREERPARPFQRVLAGIDYSPFARPVARLAAAMVSPGGSLELMHTWSPPYLSALNANLGGAGGTKLLDLIERARASEADQLDRFRQSIGLPEATSYVASGSPANLLLDRADELQADLLVIGAHGRRDLGERILGTVADRVLRHAEISVLLLPEEALPKA